MATGIRIRHGRSCPASSGGACNCTPSYEAWVFSKREGRKIRKTFSGKGALAEAKGWRSDAQGAVRKGTMKAPTKTTIAGAAEEWLALAREGVVRARGGERYKPSALRSYEKALRLRVLPEFGHVRLTDLTRPELQDYVERLQARGLSASTVQGTLLPLRAIYRRALDRGEVAIDPCASLRLPAATGERDRIAPPDEAAELLRVLPDDDRALWATAMYAGLRRGELQALRWSDVDLAAGVIRVERSWDPVEGFIEPKSKKSKRKVPIAAVLRDYLIAHRIRSEGDGLVFGRSPVSPFNPSSITKRALAAWSRAGLDPIILHECRHTFASLMIAAGVNAKALSTYLGHANISITLDRYGHLMPGSEDEAAALLDAYLARASEHADEAARAAVA